MSDNDQMNQLLRGGAVSPTSRSMPGRRSPGGAVRAGLAMAFKLVQAAQERWRRVNASHLVALVRAGATFIDDGQLRERSNEGTEEDAAA